MCACTAIDGVVSLDRVCGSACGASCTHLVFLTQRSLTQPLHGKYVPTLFVPDKEHLHSRTPHMKIITLLDTEVAHTLAPTVRLSAYICVGTLANFVQYVEIAHFHLLSVRHRCASKGKGEECGTEPARQDFQLSTGTEVES